MSKAEQGAAVARHTTNSKPQAGVRVLVPPDTLLTKDFTFFPLTDHLFPCAIFLTSVI